MNVYNRLGPWKGWENVQKVFSIINIIPFLTGAAGGGGSLIDDGYLKKSWSLPYYLGLASSIFSFCFLFFLKYGLWQKNKINGLTTQTKLYKQPRHAATLVMLASSLANDSDANVPTSAPTPLQICCLFLDYNFNWRCQPQWACFNNRTL